MTSPEEPLPAEESAVITSPDEKRDTLKQNDFGGRGDNDDDLDGADDDGSTASSVQNHVSAYDLLMSKRELKRISMFRVMVGGMLIMTAVVTGVAYHLLGKEENENFEAAVSLKVKQDTSYVSNDVLARNPQLLYSDLLSLVLSLYLG